MQEARRCHFLFVGYVKQSVQSMEGTEIDIALSAENGSMNDVVVIGYGTQRKRDLTGSVVSISAKDLAKLRSPGPIR